MDELAVMDNHNCLSNHGASNTRGHGEITTLKSARAMEYTTFPIATSDALFTYMD